MAIRYETLTGEITVDCIFAVFSKSFTANALFFAMILSCASVNVRYSASIFSYSLFVWGLEASSDETDLFAVLHDVASIIVPESINSFVISLFIILFLYVFLLFIF